MDYEARVQRYEDEGLTRSDAQAVVDAEMTEPRWIDAHSVNCHLCNALVDERECSKNAEGFDICQKCGT